MIPVGILSDGRPVLLGFDEDAGLLALDPFGPGEAQPISILSVIGVADSSPAAVFWGCELDFAEASRYLKANPVRAVPRYIPRGTRFGALPEGLVSGFSVASAVIRRNRQVTPSVDVIRVSALFAVSTVRTSIEEAERSFDCFGRLYQSAGRQMPSVDEIKACFRGLQNTKSKMFADVAAYATEIEAAIKSGYKDRELRHVLALDTKLPGGLGLTKLSFTLALLGHDCVCLDARLLNTMFPSSAARMQAEGSFGKNAEGLITPMALKRYEALEDSFLKGNPHYDPRDPIGRARAQWESWEAVGQKPAEHGVWLKLVR